MSDIVTQADRDEAAKFARQAWHLFWPNDYQRAIIDADDIATGRNDNWHLVQAFARHRIAALTEALRGTLETVDHIKSGGEYICSCGIRKQCRHDNFDNAF